MTEGVSRGLSAALARVEKNLERISTQTLEVLFQALQKMKYAQNAANDAAAVAREYSHREACLANRENEAAMKEMRANEREASARYALEALEEKRKSIEAVGAGVRKRERALAAREQSFLRGKASLEKMANELKRKQAMIAAIAEDVEQEKQKIENLSKHISIEPRNV